MADKKFPVLLRGYRDKAATLLYKGTYGDRVEVSNADETATIRVPATDAYEFDAGLVSKIEKATNSGNFQLAKKLWDSARHLKQEAVA